VAIGVAGIRHADAGVAVARALTADPHLFDNPVHVCAAGKAAGVMAAAVLDAGWPLRRLIAVGTHRPARLPPNVEWFDGGHPLPDEGSVVAGKMALALAESVEPNETLLLLLSGGASALLAVPADNVSLAAKRHTIRTMMHDGADIDALNTVRKHMSAIKGGRLAQRCRGATRTLAVSDVVGDDVSVIGSGPGVPDRTTWRDTATALRSHGGSAHDPAVLAHVDAGCRGLVAETPKPGDPDLARATATIVASRADALEGAACEARSRGYRVIVQRPAVTGEARTAALAWWLSHQASLDSIAAPLCIISGGETTVRVTGTGRGGRNQEFVLALVERLASSRRDLAVASMGTDGIDGPTDAAGALADHHTLGRAHVCGFDPTAALADNDAYTFFDALGDLIRTGRTDTNVGDLQVLLAGPST
jgi:hydroxypyruvate reductase